MKAAFFAIALEVLGVFADAQSLASHEDKAGEWRQGFSLNRDPNADHVGRLDETPEGLEKLRQELERTWRPHLRSVSRELDARIGGKLNRIQRAALKREHAEQRRAERDALERRQTEKRREKIARELDAKRKATRARLAAGNGKPCALCGQPIRHAVPELGARGMKPRRYCGKACVRRAYEMRKRPPKRIRTWTERRDEA